MQVICYTCANTWLSSPPQSDKHKMACIVLICSSVIMSETKQLFVFIGHSSFLLWELCIDILILSSGYSSSGLFQVLKISSPSLLPFLFNLVLGIPLGQKEVVYTCVYAKASRVAAAILVLRGRGILRDKKYSAVMAVTEVIPCKEKSLIKCQEETSHPPDFCSPSMHLLQNQWGTTGYVPVPGWEPPAVPPLITYCSSVSFPLLFCWPLKCRCSSGCHLRFLHLSLYTHSLSVILSTFHCGCPLSLALTF